MIYYVTNQTKLRGTFEFTQASLGRVIEYFSSKEEIQVDSETWGYDAHKPGALLLLQLGDAEKQFVIDCTTVDITPLKPLLESKLLLMHNAKFDLRFLYKHEIYPIDTIWDTYLAEKVLSNGIFNHRCSLDACTRRYLKITLNKDIRGAIYRRGVYDTAVIKYAAEDVEHMQAVRDHQVRILTEKGLMNCIRLENLFVPVLAYVEFCGIGIDVLEWKAKAKRNLDVMHNLERKLNAAIIELGNIIFLKQPDLFEPEWTANVLWSSPKQVIEVMEFLGVNTEVKDKRTNTTKKSVESTVLEKQKDIHPIVSTYIEYREASKTVTTYGESFLKHVNEHTGRIHPNFNQLMNTGRLSSGSDKENSKNASVNMQNIPRGEERKCFIPMTGNKMICGDYSGQESRILADLSQEPKLLEFYRSGEADLHSYAARLIYDYIPNNLALKLVKAKFKEERQMAKSFNFALAYGGNANTVARNLNINIEEAREAEEKYFKAFPKLKQYFEGTKKRTIADGHVLIDRITGRKFFFYKWEEFQQCKETLEDFVPHEYEDRSSYFQGLSRGFWVTRKRADEHYKDTINMHMRDYFRLKGVFEREGLNYRIQGTGASQTKYAGIKFFRHIMKNNMFGVVKIVNMVHDEIDVEAPIYFAEEVAKSLRECLIKAGNKFTTHVNMDADVEIADYWTH